MYSVHISNRSEKELNRIHGKPFQRIRQAILQMEENPRPAGCVKLIGKDSYRIRIGDYRILYEIDEDLQEVHIYRVKHRKEVYRK